MEKKKPLDKDAKTDWEVVQETDEDNDKNEESGENDNSNDNNEKELKEDENDVDMYWLTKQLISMYHQQSSPTLCHVTSSFSRGR